MFRSQSTPINRLAPGSSWLACTAFLIGLVVAFPVFAAKVEESREALQELKSRLESLKKELDTTQEAHSEAADALKKSERAISESNRKIYEIGQKQSENRQTLQQLQQEQARLNASIHDQQQLLGKLLYRQYIGGQTGYLQLALSGDDPSATARKLHYYSYIAKARADRIDSLHNNMERVAQLNQKTEQTLHDIEALKQEQEKQRQQLESEKLERKTVLAQLAGKIKEKKGEIDKLKRDEKRLTDLVERLARIVPKPKRRAPPTTAPSEPSQAQTPIRRNESVPTATQAEGDFGKLKGKLCLPVRGEVMNRFGAPREESGVSWKGLFIRAGEGAEVKAVAAGTVVFAVWLRGFGNLIIIDHGDGYMSLYGNNQAVLKKVGDEVGAGDNIASVGNSGGNPQSGLYFELRRRSQPFDPLEWAAR
jgi:septal ring factor EnvC (AmiA/AmiB activator)